MTETPGNAQSDSNVVKGLEHVKDAGTGWVPPHLRTNQEQSEVTESTDAEFAKLANDSELLHAQDTLKVAPVESSDRAINIEKETSGLLPLSSDLKSLSISSINLLKENSKLHPSTSTEPTLKVEDTVGSPVNPLTHNSAAHTLSSAEFNTASPPRGESGLTKNENQESALYFKAWPKSEERSGMHLR